MHVLRAARRPPLPLLRSLDLVCPLSPHSPVDVFPLLCAGAPARSAPAAAADAAAAAAAADDDDDDDDVAAGVSAEEGAEAAASEEAEDAPRRTPIDDGPADSSASASSIASMVA